MKFISRIIHFSSLQLKDPEDDMVLEVAAGADCIITYNKKDFINVTSFGIEILTPKELLILLGELSWAQLVLGYLTQFMRQQKY